MMLAASGFGFGLLVTALGLGLRHGIDWDHIAAITDIAGTQDDRRRALWFGTLYALGHGAVVFVLGAVAILAGGLIPEGLDRAMGRIVGATLILLGVYVFVSLLRHGRDFRLRSRWMLIFSGVRKGARWVREHVGARVHNGGEATEQHEVPTASWWHHGHHGRRGHHHHAEPEPDEHDGIGRGTAFGVGMIHGVGAETPTQVLLFIAAGQVVQGWAGVLVLIAFILGLLVSNSIITLGAAFGFLSAQKNFTLYATVAVIVGAFSLVIGVLFLFGQESVLPAFFGG
jgi:high-affinity nickel-transport protein